MRAGNSASMNQLSPRQIAAALTGHPADSSLELRLLMPFKSEAGNRADVEPEAVAESMPEAA